MFLWFLALVMGVWTFIAFYSGTARSLGGRPIYREIDPSAFWLSIAGYAAATLVLVGQAFFGGR
jgi:hypothetical protein